MTELSKAAFLSYASQDASAVQRLAQALRAGGVEVWLDTTGLRGPVLHRRNSLLVKALLRR
jgi:hypothetical protein